MQTHKLSAAELDELMATRRKANELEREKAELRKRDAEAYAARSSAENAERQRIAEQERIEAQARREAEKDKKAQEAQAARAKKERDAKLQAEIDAERAANAQRKLAAKEGRGWDTDKMRQGNGGWASPSRAPPSESLPQFGSRWDRSDLGHADERSAAEQQRVNVEGYRPTADNEAVWESVPS